MAKELSDSIIIFLATKENSLITYNQKYVLTENQIKKI